MNQPRRIAAPTPKAHERPPLPLSAQLLIEVCRRDWPDGSRGADVKESTRQLVLRASDLMMQFHAGITALEDGR